MKPNTVTGWLCMTPDGRVARCKGEKPGNVWSNWDQRLQILQPFLHACLTILPSDRLTRNERLGTLLFFLGAADRLWCRLDLDDNRFPAFAESLLVLHGLSSAQAVTLVSTLPQVHEITAARSALLEGAETLEQWLGGHDNNSVMRLSELIVQWRRMGTNLVP
jgi:hypothetical protein